MDDVDHERARRTAENIVAAHIDGDCSKGCNLARAYLDLAALNAVNETGCETALRKYEAAAATIAELTAEIDRLRAERAWRPASEAPLGEYARFRHPLWRHEFVGRRDGDFQGECHVLIDAPDGTQHGWTAREYQPIPTPPAAGKGEQS